MEKRVVAAIKGPFKKITIFVFFYYLNKTDHVVGSRCVTY